jgi:hypothetical protein
MQSSTPVQVRVGSEIKTEEQDDHDIGQGAEGAGRELRYARHRIRGAIGSRLRVFQNRCSERHLLDPCPAAGDRIGQQLVQLLQLRRHLRPDEPARKQQETQHEQHDQSQRPAVGKRRISDSEARKGAQRCSQNYSAEHDDQYTGKPPHEHGQGNDADGNQHSISEAGQRPGSIFGWHDQKTGKFGNNSARLGTCRCHDSPPQADSKASMIEVGCAINWEADHLRCNASASFSANGRDAHRCAICADFSCGPRAHVRVRESSDSGREHRSQQAVQ